MARDQLLRTDTKCTRLACAETEAGTVEGRRCTAPQERAPVKLLAAGAARAGEGTKRRPNRVHTCGVPKNWNYMQHRARSIWSSREPEQCRQGKHTHP